MTECSICLEKIENQNCELECGHKFHSSCIIKWAAEKHTCPMCRKNLTGVEKEIHEDVVAILRNIIIENRNVPLNIHGPEVSPAPPFVFVLLLTILVIWMFFPVLRDFVFVPMAPVWKQVLVQICRGNEACLDLWK